MAQDPREAWLERVLGVRLVRGDPRLEDALGEWRSRRVAVIAQLTALGQAIRAAEDPEANAALILIGGIRANITERPDTARKVKELEDYLIAESLIDDAETPNGFGVTVTIRDPLLPALRKVKDALAE
jgi:hypothetical protein